MIQPRICIAEAASRGDVELVAELMRDFLRWCRDRYAVRPWQVDAYFRPAAWRRELASLDRVYAPPDGGLLLARVDGAAAGCVALRAIGPGVAEIKRLFVSDRYRGLGAGRRLAEAAIGLARERSIAVVRLDTGDLQPEAYRLYRSLGFREIPPYYDCPRELVPHLRFMELAIRSAPPRSAHQRADRSMGTIGGKPSRVISPTASNRCDR